MTSYLDQDEIEALLSGGKKDNSWQIPGDKVAGESKKSNPEVVQQKKENLVVKKVEFAPFKQQWGTRAAGTKADPHFFGDVPLLISGELGTAEITVRELLKFEEGSVVKLNKMAGESSALLVNEQYFGQAEVVIINDRFGMRITTIGSGEVKEEKETETTKKGKKHPKSLDKG